jgi:predicted transcriptional regulator
MQQDLLDRLARRGRELAAAQERVKELEKALGMAERRADREHGRVCDQDDVIARLTTKEAALQEILAAFEDDGLGRSVDAMLRRAALACHGCDLEVRLNLLAKKVSRWRTGIWEHSAPTNRKEA